MWCEGNAFHKFQKNKLLENYLLSIASRQRACDSARKLLPWKMWGGGGVRLGDFQFTRFFFFAYCLYRGLFAGGRLFSFFAFLVPCMNSFSSTHHFSNGPSVPMKWMPVNRLRIIFQVIPFFLGKSLKLIMIYFLLDQITFSEIRVKTLWTQFWPQ